MAELASIRSAYSLLIVGRDQDTLRHTGVAGARAPFAPVRDAAFPTEVDVDEHDIRP